MTPRTGNEQLKKKKTVNCIIIKRKYVFLNVIQAAAKKKCTLLFKGAEKSAAIILNLSCPKMALQRSIQFGEFST